MSEAAISHFDIKTESHFDKQNLTLVVISCEMCKIFCLQHWSYFRVVYQNKSRVIPHHECLLFYAGKWVHFQGK